MDGHCVRCLESPCACKPYSKELFNKVATEEYVEHLKNQHAEELTKKMNGDLLKAYMKPNPFATQVSGDHYKGYKIQPVEFIHANEIPYMEGNVIKYICRHRDKNGLADLEKAKHYIELLIELEYKDEQALTNDH